MRIKTMVVTVLSVVMMMFSAVGFAQISEEDLNIGGIYFGQSMDEIVAKYGDSIRTLQGVPVGRRYVFLVDGSEIIISPGKGKAGTLMIEGDSKLLTNKGIGLQSTLDDVINVYGTPDSDEFNPVYKIRNISYRVGGNVSSSEASNLPEEVKKLVFSFRDGFICRILVRKEYVGGAGIP